MTEGHLDMGLKPLTFQRFIEVLYLMDVYIPHVPAKAGQEVLIYQSGGTGYYPRGAGPSCAFMWKDLDEYVPAKEIEKTLKLLRFSERVFIETEAACQIGPDSSEPSPKSTPEGGKADMIQAAIFKNHQGHD
jgi:hypothetical protein